MLTIGQAEKLKQLVIAQKGVVEESNLASAAIRREMHSLIDSLTVEDLKERISPVVGVIRSMEMTHEEAVQRIINVL